MGNSNSSLKNSANISQPDKNDIDEMVENKIRLENEITEETYLILKDKFFQIVTCQNGSRILQTYIFKSNLEIITKIFKELSYHLPDIITNVYGNYFCQKFFLTLKDEDRILFLEKVTNKYKKLFIFLIKKRFKNFLDHRKYFTN
jgi:uncharacterized protein YbcC (UPF0753/DUF2309 family)